MTIAFISLGVASLESTRDYSCASSA